MLYPFLVNDPGEGTQAKRRAHATLIDHLVPPMTRADSYGEIAKLEQLLDEYATVRAMDPTGRARETRPRPPIFKSFRRVMCSWLKCSGLELE